MPIIVSLILGAACLIAGLPILASAAAMYANIRDFTAIDFYGLLFALSGLLLIAGAVRFIPSWTQSWSDFKFSVALAAVVFVLKLFFLALHYGYPQLADHGIFLNFVNQLGRAGFSAEEMTRLSASYDYYIWVSRGFPFLHLLACWFPEHHVWAASILNAALQSISLILLDRVATRLGFDVLARRTGLVLLALIPFHWWQMLEYGHHILSTTVILVVILSVLKLLDACSRLALPFWSGITGLLLVVLSLQLGVDQLAFMLAAATIFFVVMTHTRPVKSMLIRSVAGMIIAAAIWQGGKTAYFNWQASFDEHQLSAGLSGFMARGWSVERLGEYDGRYEQMDRITPVDQKRDAMMAMVTSRLNEQPLFSLGVLIPVKIAKYSLIGFATAVEDSLLEMNRPRESALYRWLRLIHAPLFISLALLAVLRLAAAETYSLVVLPVVFYVIACSIFTLMGETSPRYSIYVHPAMALLAGYGLTGMITGNLKTIFHAAAKRMLRYVPAVFALYLLLAAGVSFSVKSLPPHLFMSPLKGEAGVARIPYEHFAAGLAAGGKLESDILPAGRVAFYAWPRGGSESGELIIHDAEGEVFRKSLTDMPFAGYHELVLRASSRLRFELSGGSLERIGYVRGGL